MIEHKCCVVGIASSGQGPVFLFFLFFLCLSRGAEQHFLFFRRAFFQSREFSTTQHAVRLRCPTFYSIMLPNKQTGKPRHAGPCHSAVYTRWSLFASSQDREPSKETPIYWNTRPPTAPTTPPSTPCALAQMCGLSKRALKQATIRKENPTVQYVTVSSDDHIISLGGSYLSIFSLRRGGYVGFSRKDGL